MLIRCIRAVTVTSLAIFIGGASPPHQNIREPFIAQIKEHAAKLRQAWLAAHPGQVPTVSNPEIISGTVTTPNVDAQTPPGMPGVQVKFKTGNSGLGDIFIRFVDESGDGESACGEIYPSWSPQYGPKAGQLPY
jgi:hypothetical protein